LELFAADFSRRWMFNPLPQKHFLFLPPHFLPAAKIKSVRILFGRRATGMTACGCLQAGVTVAGSGARRVTGLFAKAKRTRRAIFGR